MYSSLISIAVKSMYYFLSVVSYAAHLTKVVKNKYNNLNKKIIMNKTTSYILAGVKAEDEQVFMQRVGELLERNDLIDLFANGVPVSAVVVDEAAFLEDVAKKNNRYHNPSIKEGSTISISGNGSMSLYIKYTRTLYYKTEEAAARCGYSDGWESSNDDHPFPGEHEDCSNINVTGMAGIKVLYV